eukprot:757663-Hanusia_phi.AAC.1
MPVRHSPDPRAGATVLRPPPVQACPSVSSGEPFTRAERLADTAQKDKSSCHRGYQDSALPGRQRAPAICACPPRFQPPAMGCPASALSRICSCGMRAET